MAAAANLSPTRAPSLDIPLARWGARDPATMEASLAAGASAGRQTMGPRAGAPDLASTLTSTLSIWARRRRNAVVGGLEKTGRAGMEGAVTRREGEVIE